jgi:hypothetical protein
MPAPRRNRKRRALTWSAAGAAALALSALVLGPAGAQVGVRRPAAARPGAAAPGAARLAAAPGAARLAAAPGAARLAAAPGAARPAAARGTARPAAAPGVAARLTRPASRASSGLGRAPAATRRHVAGGGVPGNWAGFGGSLATWAKARHRDLTDCVAGSCYGPKVLGTKPAYAFNDVTTTDGKVTGWWQALPQGTTPAQAEISALALFPDDTQLSHLVVLPHDLFGASCAFLNVQSDTLAKWFGAKSVVVTGGQAAIELFTLDAQGLAAWNPGNIDRVIVIPEPYGQGDNC